MSTDYTQRDADAETEMMIQDAAEKEMNRLVEMRNKLESIQTLIGDQPLSLAIGDVVIFNGHTDIDNVVILPDQVSEEVLVTAISASGDEYGIDGLNWVPRTALKFERRADPESLMQAIIFIENEDKEEWEE